MPIELKVISASNSDGNGSFSANFRKKIQLKIWKIQYPTIQKCSPCNLKANTTFTSHHTQSAVDVTSSG